MRRRSWLYRAHQVFGCPEIPVDPPYDGYVWVCRCGAFWEGQVYWGFYEDEGPPWVRVSG